MMRTAALVLVVLFATNASASAQRPPQIETRQPLPAAIDALGSFEFDIRTRAAREIRRASAADTAALLEAAVRKHRDEYVRFRAFVLLSAIDETAAARVARDMIGDRNDRVRTVAFQWFGRHPDAAVIPRLVDALPAEQSEFVRPALTRALAAHGQDPRAKAALLPLVVRGEDSFRGAVIEALGDFRATYALREIADVAALDGPLQDDAITAIGKLGDVSMRATLASLQKTVPPDLLPTVAAALCLIGVECEAQFAYLTKTLTFAATTEGYQPLLRGAVHALAVLAASGHADALRLLLDSGVAASDATRAPIALSIGLVAFRDPGLVIRAVTDRMDATRVIELVGEAFEMLSEDFEEEQLYADVRRAYWAAPEGAPQRRLLEALIERLEF